MPKKQRNPSRDNQEPQKKWRRVIIYSDSDESEKSDSEKEQDAGITLDLRRADDGIASDPTPLQIELSPEEPILELDAELLSALGDPAEDAPDYGAKIVQDLAQRWLPILRKGIPKDKKDSLLKEHTIPENCKLLRAPTLNVEMAAAIPDLSRARDKRLEISQNQLGLGISAVGKGLSLLLTGDDKQKKVQAIKSISDGCRLLADLHYTETESRTKLITPCLDKSFVRTMHDLERDETLFGSKLSNKIKASKTIEKQGFQIKRAPPVQKTPSALAVSLPLSSLRSRPQGNANGPSRYPPTNRGGRGGAQRYGAGRKSQAPTYHGKTSTATSASSSKPRAPTR